MSAADHITVRPRSEIEAVQEANFSKTMALVHQRHPYYRILLGEMGLGRDEFATLSDLARLPVTTKHVYTSKPGSFRLDTNGLPESSRALWDVMHTTGTTAGRPTPFYSTTYDFYRILSIQEGMMRIRGVGAGDSIANLFPLTVWPHGAFNRVLHAAAAMKIPVVSAMPGNPSEDFRHGSRLDEVVHGIERGRPTILWGVSGYLLRVLRRAEELGSDFSSVHFVFVTGETTSENMRTDMVERLCRLGAPDVFVSISYGATELQGGLVECAPGSGFHNPAPDQFYIEITDPETGRPLEDGEPGLVLISHLDRRGTLLLRYSLGDMSVLSREPCPICGSETDRLIMAPVRIDSLFKIKGMLVNPDVIRDVLATQSAIREYRIEIDKENPADSLSPDCLRILIDTSRPDIGPEITRRIKSAIGILPVVELATDLAGPGTGQLLKSPGVVDRRPKPS